MSAHNASDFAGEEPNARRASKKTASSSLSPYQGGQGRENERTDERLVAVRFSEMPYPPERRYLLEDLVPENYPTVIYGEGGVAKSILALSLGISVAEGIGEWLGKRLRKANVLYVDFELDQGEQARRAFQLARGLGLREPLKNLFYLEALGVPSATAFETVRKECERHDIGLVVIDSVGLALRGDSVASGDVIEFHQRYVDPLRAKGAAVLLVDHQSKRQRRQKYVDKTTFGSVYKELLARSVIQVEPASVREENTLTVNLRQTKHNFGPKCAAFGAKLTFSDQRVTVKAVELDPRDSQVGKEPSARDKVIQALKEGLAYPDEIAEATELAKKTVQNELTKLRIESVVEYTGQRRGQARQVRLVSPSSSLRGDEDGDTLPSSEEVFDRVQALKCASNRTNMEGRGAG